MLNLFLTSLANFGLNNNLVINSGVGTVLFGREKQYRFFRYINLLFLLLGIIVCSFAVYFLDNYVCLKYDLSEIKVGVLILLVCLYNLLVAFVWGKISSFGHYLYERSCSYVFDVVFTAFIALSLDVSLAIVPFVLTLAAAVVVIFLTNVVVGFFVETINKPNMALCFANVSARLYLLAIFGVLLYYANMLI